MSIHHVSLPAGPSNYKVMRDFYVAILQPLGYTVYIESDLSAAAPAPGTTPQYCGLQSKNSVDFWLHAGPLDPPSSHIEGEHKRAHGKGVHVAWLSDSTQAVDEWYKNALVHGGISNGEPGERPHYMKGY